MTGRSRERYALLLSGGSGTRFWPKSRQHNPKQFLDLYKDKSLFCCTIERILPLICPENIFIASSLRYRDRLRAFCRPYGIPERNFLLEPSPKNTAPCIATGVQVIAQKDPQARICVLPCDHLIRNEAKFRSILSRAFAASARSMVIFGIPPSRPETGYGYIRVACKEAGGKGVYRVERFLEKPDRKTAERFLKDKRYYWNSGMFIASARVFLDEIGRHLPEFSRHLAAVRTAADMKKIWAQAPAVSFDYAVMEKARAVSMIPARDIGWSDLGGWKAYDELLTKDSCHNHMRGDAVGVACRNVTVLAHDRFVAAVGLKDVIIIDTPDALLIADKERASEVKSIVEYLKKLKRTEI